MFCERNDKEEALLEVACKSLIFVLFCLSAACQEIFKDPHIPRTAVCRLICGLWSILPSPLINGHILCSSSWRWWSHHNLLAAFLVWGTALRALYTLFYLILTMCFWDGYFKFPFHVARPRFKSVKTFHIAGDWQNIRKVLPDWGLRLLGKVYLWLFILVCPTVFENWDRTWTYIKQKGKKKKALDRTTM